MEYVSVLLGHRSIGVTEKHHSLWVRATQEQLEADVRQSWRLSLAGCGSGQSAPRNTANDVTRLRHVISVSFLTECPSIFGLVLALMVILLRLGPIYAVFHQNFRFQFPSDR